MITSPTASTTFLTTGSITAELAAQHRADLLRSADSRRLARLARQPRRVAPDQARRPLFGLGGIATAR